MVKNGSTKRQKHHDKDKYYKLAKEQGLRSRAAFKLSQINRSYPILHGNTKVVLDLCAAPGGWTQIVGRVCGPQTSIIAVDILPIRSLGKRNITTIIGDITTDKCKSDINRAIAIESLSAASAEDKSGGGRKKEKKDGIVDVVINDGAPNIGASYDKDAYQQTELAVHALKCATQHLRHMGSFVTKIYRSRDSASYMWVLQQLFRDVATFKPKASRQQSAEIFYVCQGYYKPDKIDPRLLDPKHIFEYVEGNTTGASDASGASMAVATNGKFNVFHKSWDVAKRQRGGYDTDHLDATLRHTEPVTKFVFDSTNNVDAISTLSTCTGLSFRCEECDRIALLNKNKTKKNKMKTSNHSCLKCSFLLNHPLTTPEIKTCVVDLKLLNKGDFKGLVMWREKMITSWKQKEKDDKANNSDASDDDSDASNSDSDDDDGDDEAGSAGDDDEDEIQKEIRKARERKQRERKKIKKKERKVMAKKRRQSAFGMDLNAIDVQEHDQFFSLATLNSKSTKDLHDISEVNLDRVTTEQAFGKDSDSDDSDSDAEHNNIPGKEDTESGYSYRMEKELDMAYDKFIQTTKNGENKIGTKTAKRSKKLLREKMAQQSHEDHELLLNSERGVGAYAKAYVQLLQGPQDSDDDDDDEEVNMNDDSDGFDEEPMTPAEHKAKNKKKKNNNKKEENEKVVDFTTSDTSDDTAGTNGNTNKNPLIHEFPDEPTPMKTARWFSNPLFAEIGQTVNAATTTSNAQNGDKNNDFSRDLDPLVDNDNDEDKMNDDAAKSAAKSAAAASIIIAPSLIPPPPSSITSTKKNKNTKQKKNANTVNHNKMTKNKDMDDNNNNKEGKKEKKITADDVLAMMPRTDKQKRHEKRIKAKERDERRQARKAKKMGEEGNLQDFDLAPGAVSTARASAANNDDDDEDDEDLMKMEGMSDEKKKKIMEARKLIKAGIGSIAGAGNKGRDSESSNNNNDRFEIVKGSSSLMMSSSVLPAKVDDRKYDSDNEEYDSEDYAETMALGTMMLRHSKSKALVDASYNRFAWNDPSELPEWFVDDENRNYRPQLPIPPALLAKMKEKMFALSVRPIAKVAEARARKNRKAKSKLASAKKKAQSVANSSDMSEAMKLRSITKALRSEDKSTGKNGKNYVVTKKGQGKRGVKGGIMVDKTMKSDKRGMERAAKKRKGGKKGGLTGSKKRRNHK